MDFSLTDRSFRVHGTTGFCTLWYRQDKIAFSAGTINFRQSLPASKQTHNRPIRPESSVSSLLPVLPGKIDRFHGVAQVGNHDRSTYDKGHIHGVLQFLIRES